MAYAELKQAARPGPLNPPSNACPPPLLMEAKAGNTVVRYLAMACFFKLQVQLLLFGFSLNSPHFNFTSFLQTGIFLRFVERANFSFHRFSLWIEVSTDKVSTMRIRYTHHSIIPCGWESYSPPPCCSVVNQPFKF